MPRKRINSASILTNAEKQKRHREKRKAEGRTQLSTFKILAKEIMAATKETDQYGYVKLHDFVLKNWAAAIETSAALIAPDIKSGSK